MNLLDKLFKPATNVKPQELNYKHCRTDWGEGFMPVLFVRDYKEGKGVFTDDLGKEFILAYSDVEYLDDSKEALKELMRPFYNAGWEDSREFHDPYIVEWYDSWKGCLNADIEEGFDQWLLTKEAEQTTKP